MQTPENSIHRNSDNIFEYFLLKFSGVDWISLQRIVIY